MLLIHIHIQTHATVLYALSDSIAKQRTMPRVRNEQEMAPA